MTSTPNPYPARRPFAGLLEQHDALADLLAESTQRLRRSHPTEPDAEQAAELDLLAVQVSTLRDQVYELRCQVRELQMQQCQREL